MKSTTPHMSSPAKALGRNARLRGCEEIDSPWQMEKRAPTRGAPTRHLIVRAALVAALTRPCGDFLHRLLRGLCDSVTLGAAECWIPAGASPDRDRRRE